MIPTAENYHSLEACQEYMGASQYKDFAGSAGMRGCEALAMAKLKGEWKDEPTPAMIMSSYVDAHFAGTLDIFKAKNADICFTKKGILKSSFQKAEEIVKRVERDEYFMKYMSGETQVIMTGEFFRCKWKVAIDSLVKDTAIVDLKVMKSLADTLWVKDLGHTSFVTYYGYDIQGAIYQTIVDLNTGKLLPFFIAGASKEKEPDIEIIGIDNRTLRNAYIEIEGNIERILAIKCGAVKPDKCGVCDYCKSIKVLSKPVHYSELNSKI